jgi:hypothetical protein
MERNLYCLRNKRSSHQYRRRNITMYVQKIKKVEQVMQFICNKMSAVKRMLLQMMREKLMADQA